jgi:hypothetical protein
MRGEMEIPFLPHKIALYNKSIIFPENKLTKLFSFRLSLKINVAAAWEKSMTYTKRNKVLFQQLLKTKEEEKSHFVKIF